MRKNVKVCRVGSKTSVVYHNGRVVKRFKVGESGARHFARMIGLYLSALLIVGFIVAEGVMLFAPRVTEAEPEVRTITVIDESLPPIMVKIASCESSGEHFDSNGQVKLGKKNPNDIGKFQINQTTWGRKAHELGYDIYDERGNEDMARWIFFNQGTGDWSLSKKCWNK